MLTKAVEQYHSLRQLHAAEGGAQSRQHMNDAAYTLCVITGTRDVDTALMIARRQLAPAPQAEPA